MRHYCIRVPNNDLERRDSPASMPARGSLGRKRPSPPLVRSRTGHIQTCPQHRFVRNGPTKCAVARRASARVPRFTTKSWVKLQGLSVECVYGYRSRRRGILVNFRELCMIDVGVMLIAGAGTAVNDRHPAWAPAWPSLRSAIGVALIASLAVPTIRNSCRNR